MEPLQLIRTISSGQLSNVSLMSDGEEERTQKSILLYHDERDKELFEEVNKLLYF